MFSSINQSIKAQKLHYDGSQLKDLPVPDPTKIKNWQDEKNMAMSISLLLYQLGVPTLALSLSLLLNGALLTALLYCVAFSYLKIIILGYLEDRKVMNGIIKAFLLLPFSR
ncbi:hypothetical protein D3C77_532750 [compost metagenome]